ncbi:MAG: hypothetical protein U0838_02335 [Chloroflexota bacterium]
MEQQALIESQAQPDGPSVADKLFESASYFARSSVTAYRNEDWAVFYLHLATALELTVKGTLAHANPAFIADATRFDAVLHLTGFGARARVPEFLTAAKTIGVGEALARVSRLIDQYDAPGDLVQVLVDRRNGVAHAGTVVRGQEAGILGEVGRYVAPLLAYARRSTADLWGDGDDAVTELAQKRLTEIEASCRRRIEAARLRFNDLVDRVGEAALESLIESRQPDQPSWDFTEFPAQCPACEYLGTVRGQPEPEWEPEYDSDGDEEYVSGATVKSIRLWASTFSCGVCGLELSGDELKPARLAYPKFDGDDFNLDDASKYFEADEPDVDDYDDVRGR